MENTKKFLKEQGNTFHIELLTLVNTQRTDEDLTPSTVLFFDYPEGRYSITFEELQKKAKVEIKRFIKKYKTDEDN
jgi:hypothetical protein